MGNVAALTPEIQRIIDEAKDTYDESQTIHQVGSFLKASELVKELGPMSTPEAIRRKMAFLVDMMATKVITGEIEPRTVNEVKGLMEVAARLARDFEYEEIGEALAAIRDPVKRRQIMAELRERAAAANQANGPS